MHAADEGPSPEEQVASRQLAALIEAAVDELPPIYRVVFVLREIEGLATSEAAEALEISADAVKQRLHRARHILRERLTARLKSHASGAYLFEAPRCNRVVAAVFEELSRLG